MEKKNKMLALGVIAIAMIMIASYVTMISAQGMYVREYPRWSYNYYNTYSMPDYYFRSRYINMPGFYYSNRLIDVPGFDYRNRFISLYGY